MDKSPNADERVLALEQRLGFVFSDKRLPLSAVTHKSYANEHKDPDAPDNERLEFLGDAVVDLAISHRLMERFPQAQEGELSKLRALIVNEDGLARVARALRLGELLLLGRGEEMTGGREKASVLADAFEAVLGAVYLCSGLTAVLAVVDALFHDALDGVAEGRVGQDWKTRLQEEAQLKLKVAPRYRVVQETGPDHEKVFEIEVVVGAAISARANGRSKKEAEQAAARIAIEQVSSLPMPSSSSVPAPAAGATSSTASSSSSSSSSEPPRTE